MIGHALKLLGEIRVGIFCKKGVPFGGSLFSHCDGLDCGFRGNVPAQAFLSIASGEATLGIYAAAAAPVALIQTGASYIYNPLLGYFSERFAANDRAGFSSLMIKATFGIVALGLICSIGVIVLGEPALVLFYGSKMSGYGYLLLPLVALSLLTGYMWFINDLLMAVRNFRGAFIGNAVALAASLFCLPLIEDFWHGWSHLRLSGILYCRRFSNDGDACDSA